MYIPDTGYRNRNFSLDFIRLLKRHTNCKKFYFSTLLFAFMNNIYMVDISSRTRPSMFPATTLSTVKGILSNIQTVVTVQTVVMAQK